MWIRLSKSESPAQVAEAARTGGDGPGVSREPAVLHCRRAVQQYTARGLELAHSDRLMYRTTVYSSTPTTTLTYYIGKYRCKYDHSSIAGIHYTVSTSGLSKSVPYPCGLT